MYANDSFFTQLKEIEIVQEQVRAANELKDYVGIYFSHDYVLKKIFGMTDTEILAMRAKLEEEKKDPFFKEEEDDAINNFEGGYK